MNSRMDRYEFENNDLPKRTERNQELYRSSEMDNYDKFDVNSNISVLKNDARKIDIDQIKDMLDKKYRDNIPQRRTIDIPEFEEPVINEDEDTKEYDLNSVLSKVKEDASVDYDSIRANKAYRADELVEKINEKYTKNSEYTKEEEELKELINTITSLEIKNQKKNADLLGLGDDSENEDDEETMVKTATELIPATKQQEEFYTGQLAVTEDDFDDFKEMQKDIKSNSIFIKVLVFIVIIILLALGVYLINNIFELGLF